MNVTWILTRTTKQDAEVEYLDGKTEHFHGVLSETRTRNVHPNYGEPSEPEFLAVERLDSIIMHDNRMVVARPDCLMVVPYAGVRKIRLSLAERNSEIRRKP